MDDFSSTTTRRDVKLVKKRVDTLRDLPVAPPCAVPVEGVTPRRITVPVPVVRPVLSSAPRPGSYCIINPETGYEED